jgi:hypothetical protein
MYVYIKIPHFCKNKMYKVYYSREHKLQQQAIRFKAWKQPVAEV